MCLDHCKFYLFYYFHNINIFVVIKNEVQRIRYKYGYRAAKVLLVNPLLPSGPCGCRVTTTLVNNFSGLWMWSSGLTPVASPASLETGVVCGIVCLCSE